MAVKFGIFADLHTDIIHDPEERLGVFLDACRKENVDFIVHLGDFVYPDENRSCVCKPENIPENVANALAQKKSFVNKDKLLEMFNGFEKPSYHVIGNHECDMCSKQQILEYCGGQGAYYSFDCGGFHFVVLDPNYMKPGDTYISYERGNYFDESYHSVPVLPYLPDEQLAWLEKDLKKAKYPACLLSHQRLTEGCDSILNWEELRPILLNAPRGVVLALNGHEHRETIEKKDDIWFLNINSMSNFWVGEEYTVLGRYGAEIDEKFPDIRYIIPYRDPLYAIITMDEKGAEIQGTKTDFVGKTPDEMGIHNPGTRFTQNGIRATAEIKNRYLPFPQH